MSVAVNRQLMTIVKLSGSLAKAFWRQKSYLLESGTTNEVMSALKHTVEGFESEITRLSRLGVRFAIFRNRQNVGTDEFGLTGTAEVRIVPIISGSKRGGLFQTIAGVALMVASIWLGPVAFSIGLSLTIGGVSQLLTPVAKTATQQEQATTENKPSYLFNGAFNSTQQGLPVPIVYGQMLVGSSVVGVGTWAEAIPA
jgi:predicted phage tail protein